MTTENITKVVFRVWPNQNVIALFPYEPFDRIGLFCDSYEHIGQHGAADYLGVLSATRPATKDEYADLYAELESIGYVLDVIKRKGNRK